MNNQMIFNSLCLEKEIMGTCPGDEESFKDWEANFSLEVYGWYEEGVSDKG